MTVGIREMMFYGGPPPPTGRATHLHWHLRQIAEDGAVEVAQAALGAAIGCNRGTIGRLLTQLDAAGCLIREPGYMADGTRAPDRLRIPLMAPDDPRAPSVCRQIDQGIAQYRRGNVADCDMATRPASSLCRQIDQEFLSGTEVESKSARTRWPSTPLPLGFPDEAKRRWAHELFEAEGLAADVDTLAEKFRALNRERRLNDWPGWWRGYVERAFQIEQDRRARGSKRAATGRR